MLALHVGLLHLLLPLIQLVHPLFRAFLFSGASTKQNRAFTFLTIIFLDQK